MPCLILALEFCVDRWRNSSAAVFLLCFSRESIFPPLVEISTIALKKPIGFVHEELRGRIFFDYVYLRYFFIYPPTPPPAASLLRIVCLGWAKWRSCETCSGPMCLGCDFGWTFPCPDIYLVRITSFRPLVVRYMCLGEAINHIFGH